MITLTNREVSHISTIEYNRGFKAGFAVALILSILLTGVLLPIIL